MEINIYYSDGDPTGPDRRSVHVRRTLHLRTNELDDPLVPLDTDYAVVVESSRSIFVQHTRFDSRQAENAVLTTMAFPVT